MIRNAETPRRVSGASQEVLFAAGGGTAATVARPFLLARGRVEYGVRCPECRAMHRHVHLGAVEAPCGATYLVQPRRGRAV